MTSQTGQQIIALHILPNSSRCKGIRAMKVGQLIQYSVRNVFLQIIQKLRWGNLFQAFFLKKKPYTR